MNRALADQLQQLVPNDTNVRQRLLDEGRLFDGYAQAMETVHRENAQALRKLVEAQSWPDENLVGIDGMRAAWLFAQHTICTPDLQRYFLDRITKAASEGNVPMQQAAMLTDRIRFNEGNAQVYGTVYDWQDDGNLGCDVDDPVTVDERRRAVGLPPFEQALEDQRRAVAAEGGRPPDNLAAYRRDQLAWANRTGWR